MHNGKTWVDFKDLKDDVEKQEFVVASTSDNDVLEINSKQSEVFTGPLKKLNLLDQVKREMVEQYLVLPGPKVFH